MDLQTPTYEQVEANMPMSSGENDQDEEPGTAHAKNNNNTANRCTHAMRPPSCPYHAAVSSSARMRIAHHNLPTTQPPLAMDKLKAAQNDHCNNFVCAWWRSNARHQQKPHSPPPKLHPNKNRQCPTHKHTPTTSATDNSHHATDVGPIT